MIFRYSSFVGRWALGVFASRCDKTYSTTLQGECFVPRRDGMVKIKNHNRHIEHIDFDLIGYLFVTKTYSTKLQGDCFVPRRDGMTC